MNQGDATLCGLYLDQIVPDQGLCRKIADNYDRAIGTGLVLRYEEDTEGFSKPVTIFETTISPLLGGDGKATYICGISRNITARRNAENALRATNITLEQQLQENQRLQEKLKQEAIRDPLTNLYNRRYFMESLQRELDRAQRGQYALTLMMVDLDYFKELNDLHGHSVGDHALVEFSQRLAQGMRKEDVVCRWGGEEFLVMMPGLGLVDARDRIIRWHKHNSPMKIRRNDKSVLIRFSIGLATAPDHGLQADEIINATDNALYLAKKAGRDRICVADEN